MKIKFLDNPEEIIEVITAQQLTGTKARVTPETSRQIQEAAFKLGFRWGFTSRNQKLEYIESPFMYFRDNLSLGTGIVETIFRAIDSREFILVSPETETDLTKQLETLQGPQAFIQTFDKVNPEPLNGWISVDDKTPEVNSEVLCFNEAWFHEDYKPTGTLMGFIDDNGDWTVGKWNNEHDYYETFYPFLPPSHWMPLPEPPKTLNS